MLYASSTTPSLTPMTHPAARSSFLRSKLAVDLVSPSYLSIIQNLDIYISMVSSAHAVCAKGLYIAMVSALVETDKPELEIRPALDLLGGVIEYFTDISTLYEPINDGRSDNLFITKSYDPQSHFEMASEEVLELYERITGEKLDLNIEPAEDEEY